MAKKALVLVDGDLQRQDGLGNRLTTEGYTVETPGDSWQAIQKMKECHYDIAVIDLDLPPVHGVALTPWDLGRMFRAYNPAISIVYLSGAGTPERKEKWLQSDVHIERGGGCVL